MALLRTGDIVEWSGGWGSNVPLAATVTKILLGSGEIEVPAVPWSAVKDREVMVDLSNGHWAYGFQIKSTEEEEES